MKAFSCAMGVLFFLASPCSGEEAVTGTAPTSYGLNVSRLSQAQVAQGLKQALDKGVQQAIAELGHNDGFLTNLQVRIPMPQQLARVETTLRALGENQLADEFVATMNHAAEQAVAQAAGVFVQAVQQMTIQDAIGIATGPQDSATQFFRRTTQTNLYEKFLPIVRGATDKTGVTATYKRLLGVAGQNRYVGALENLLFNNSSLDLDSYVTDRALDGLYKIVAQEEARIRTNPVARTTQLLQEVFGALTRTGP
jgi:uncharacterized protein DUF4197